MRRGALVLLVALGGCLLPGRERDAVFVSEGVADGSSFDCSRRGVRGLGYSVMQLDEATETLHAFRYLGRSGDERMHGYLTVSVAQDSAGRHLLVAGERTAERANVTRPRFPTPVPTPIPEPQPVPVPGRNPPPEVPRARTTGPRRVSPGEVASHARYVVRRCGVGGETRATD
ncbi:MAG TPA: hypothetical protein VF092_28930 [Longimicrobium sp.]